MELGEICRTCLRRGRPVLPLFEESQEPFAAGTPLADFVNMFTDIMLFRTEGFPEQICTTCLNDVKRAYAFKLRCECSETILYQLQETNHILNLADFDFDSVYAQTAIQYNENQMKHWNETEPVSENVLEITDSVMNFLQIETADEEISDDALQIELNTIVQQKVYVKSKLETVNGESKEEESGKIEVENGGFLVCSACPAGFRSRDLLRTHVIDYHTNGNVCILCNQEFECIWTHSEKHLLPRLQCSHCNQKFEYRPLLNAHLRTHMVKNEETGKLEFKCERCPKTFATHHDYMSHRRTHSEDRPFSCDTCGMAFKRRDKLKAHMTSHSDERPFECNLCQSRFKRKDNLTSHMKSVHLQGDKVFKCNICDKAFKFKDKLKAHMNTHLRLFSCETCHAGFPRKESLDRHIEQKHRTEKASTQGAAAVPIKTETVEMKPFQCSICKKEFSLQEALSNHMKTHVKKVELKCELCSKIFSQSNKLKSHMITHTDVRPFQCTFCPSLFKRKDNLNRHMKKHSRTKVGTTNLRSSDRKVEACEIKYENHFLPSENCDNELNNAIGHSQLNEYSQVDSIKQENDIDSISDGSFTVMVHSVVNNSNFPADTETEDHSQVKYGPNDNFCVQEIKTEEFLIDLPDNSSYVADKHRTTNDITIAKDFCDHSTVNHTITTVPAFANQTVDNHKDSRDSGDDMQNHRVVRVANENVTTDNFNYRKNYSTISPASDSYTIANLLSINQKELTSREQHFPLAQEPGIPENCEIKTEALPDRAEFANHANHKNDTGQLLDESHNHFDHTNNVQLDENSDNRSYILTKTVTDVVHNVNSETFESTLIKTEPV